MKWVLLSLMSATCSAASAIFGRLAVGHVDPIVAATVNSVIISTMLVATCCGLHKTQLSAIPWIGWAILTLAGAAGTLTGIFYFSALQVGSAGKVTAIDRLSLVITLILAALFLGETITGRQAVGAILMVLGAWLVSVR